ncbi:unnamed protein product [Sphagnum jensenii]|uniref:Uncharacterized protein n=1 Tax=Sphagnum jensenii TaxID=128206 RepID=A0ABP0WZI6_9BRYO
MDSGGAPLLENTRRMAWKWILQKVVRCPDFGTTFSKGYQVFLNSGSHRFENSWASPAGSHQPFVTYD